MNSTQGLKKRFSILDASEDADLSGKGFCGNFTVSVV